MRISSWLIIHFLVIIFFGKVYGYKTLNETENITLFGGETVEIEYFMDSSSYLFLTIIVPDTEKYQTWNDSLSSIFMETYTRFSVIEYNNHQPSDVVVNSEIQNTSTLLRLEPKHRNKVLIQLHNHDLTHLSTFVVGLSDTHFYVMDGILTRYEFQDYDKYFFLYLNTNFSYPLQSLFTFRSCTPDTVVDILINGQSVYTTVDFVGSTILEMTDTYNQVYIVVKKIGIYNKTILQIFAQQYSSYNELYSWKPTLENSGLILINTSQDSLINDTHIKPEFGLGKIQFDEDRSFNAEYYILYSQSSEDVISIMGCPDELILNYNTNYINNNQKNQSVNIFKIENDNTSFIIGNKNKIYVGGFVKIWTDELLAPPIHLIYKTTIIEDVDSLNYITSASINGEWLWILFGNQFNSIFITISVTLYIFFFHFIFSSINNRNIFVVDDIHTQSQYFVLLDLLQKNTQPINFIIYHKLIF